MKSSICYAIFSALLTAFAILAAPAEAQPIQGSNGTISQIVSTADLDLSTPAGRAALDRRVHKAAKNVCGSASDSDLVGKNRVRECRQDVTARALQEGEAIADATARGDVVAVSAAR